MTDIFREVQEDVRQEQLTVLLKTHGIKFAAAIGALIIAYGSYNYWQSDQMEQVAAASDQYAAAIDSLEGEDAAGAASQFAAIRAERGSSDYGLLAAFREAEALMTQGNVSGAVAIYDQVTGDSGVDSFLRDLAQLYAASALIDGDKGEEGVARLETLLENGNPLRRSALEAKGYWLYSTGNMDEARNIFTELQAEATDGTSFSGRAAQMLSVIGSGDEETAE